MRNSKAQTTMILLIFLVLMFAGMASFLFSLAGTVKQEDYMDLKVNNLMLSMMRTDTGYNDKECRTVSDLVACSYVNSNHICERSGKTCYQLANESLSRYISEFASVKNYRFYLTVSPADPECLYIYEGEIIEPEFGDLSLKDSREKKRVANYPIAMPLVSECTLEAKLMVANK